jgi:hypothetical protein
MSLESESDLVESDVLKAVVLKRLDSTPFYLRRQNSTKSVKDMKALSH